MPSIKIPAGFATQAQLDAAGLSAVIVFDPMGRSISFADATSAQVATAQALAFPAQSPPTPPAPPSVEQLRASDAWVALQGCAASIPAAPTDGSIDAYARVRARYVALVASARAKADAAGGLA